MWIGQRKQKQFFLLEYDFLYQYINFLIFLQEEQKKEISRLQELTSLYFEEQQQQQPLEIIKLKCKVSNLEDTNQILRDQKAKAEASNNQLISINNQRADENALLNIEKKELASLNSELNLLLKQKDEENTILTQKNAQLNSVTQKNAELNSLNKEKDEKMNYYSNELKKSKVIIQEQMEQLQTLIAKNAFLIEDNSEKEKIEQTLTEEIEKLSKKNKKMITEQEQIQEHQHHQHSSQQQQPDPLEKFLPSPRQRQQLYKTLKDMGFEHIKSINNPKEVANEGKQS